MYALYCTCTAFVANKLHHYAAGARFTKYLTTVLRLSYDNAIVTIDWRRTTNLPNRLTKDARLFLGMIDLP